MNAIWLKRNAIFSLIVLIPLLLLSANAASLGSSFADSFNNGQDDPGSSTASIISPLKGSQLTSSTVTFTWTAETGATSYQIWIGNSVGGNDIASATTSSLALTLTGVPTDSRRLYVTLRGYAGGTWTTQDSATYTAAAPGSANFTISASPT